MTVTSPGVVQPVPGTYSTDHRTWTANSHFRVATAYTVTAGTVDRYGKTATGHTVFTTSQPPDSLKIDLISPADGATVGIAQPVVLAFTRPITDRAALERSLSVVSVPPQSGHWSWMSPKRVDYRPQSFWQPGTHVSVHMALDGVAVGGGRYGVTDRDVSFAVGRDQETTVDLRRDVATVQRDGQTVRTFPVTGGMPGLDSWSGVFAVIDKAADVHMNSETVGLGHAYDVPDVKWDVHLTYSGTYLHSAPWSVGSQGVRNVSHGCIGASPSNAQWFFESTLPGDVVKVINTPRQVAPGNGFADWQELWPQWLAGSALPS